MDTNEVRNGMDRGRYKCLPRFTYFIKRRRRSWGGIILLLGIDIIIVFVCFSWTVLPGEYDDFAPLSSFQVGFSLSCRLLLGGCLASGACFYLVGWLDGLMARSVGFAMLCYATYAMLFYSYLYYPTEFLWLPFIFSGIIAAQLISLVFQCFFLQAALLACLRGDGGRASN
ncbi:hypothetical protein V8F06_003774 [Rhypophila decipiens]